MTWDPEICDHVLPVTTTRSNASSTPLRLPLDSLMCGVMLISAPDRRRHILFHDSQWRFQLVVLGAGDIESVVLMAEAIIRPEGLSVRLRSLACLSDLVSSRQLLARHFPPEPRGVRLGLVLRALDGSLAGASHREIAAALYGPARVKADWSDAREHLRDSVRRAIRSGRALMNCGYRRYLRSGC